MTRENTRQRDADFANRCLAIVRRQNAANLITDRDGIIAEALSSRPLSFYVSFDYALSRLAALRRHESRTHGLKASAGQRALWLELGDLVDRHMRRSPKIKLTDALTLAINYGRPSRFYISRRKAREIFDNAIAGQTVYHPRRNQTTHLP